ncbi:GNAT family N-acetyltransferase [Lactiplantibacillus modestisalitolerans]|uniref:GNAT family N-acetyltransferase n=1 Tax=Lactiplantibacillus modestisalitolerans TaxID=1457219 RepID=A0ABV5WXC5_9LACO|nr:GNAT family N-acetyltransferase [Lactiplantibacillus modestisalitolerans]
MMVQTRRVRLRRLIESDLADYQRLLSFPVMAWANHAANDLSPATLAIAFEKDRHSPYAFAVIGRHSHRLIGVILYYHHRMTPAERLCALDLAYFLDPAVWGRGLMPEAIQLSFELIRGKHDRWLWADCLLANRRSQRVLEKVGFQAVRTVQMMNTTEPDPVAVNQYRLRLTATDE